MPANAGDRIAAFLQQHWAFPISPQGRAPASYTALEASLNPESCGSCHPKQYEGWRSSRHAHAMGPGVTGQLLALGPDSIGELRDCTRCHAPLAEQETSLEQRLLGKKQDNALHERGLICAGCHVRRNVRYGPPPRQSLGFKAHDGFVVSKAFEDGRFCATCHQFGKDGYALNGKPLENTYAEWQSSPYAKQGRQCQGCHMPDRQHLWRGIHDPDMSRKALTIAVTAPVLRNGRLNVRIALTNSGAGHDFPTYVTPRVLVEMYQESAEGRLIQESLREMTIGRQVSADLSKEIADTRLAPGKTASLDYKLPRHPGAKTMVVQVRVEPDHFYTQLYRSLLDSNGREKAMIRKALYDSQRSGYDLFVGKYPLSR